MKTKLVLLLAFLVTHFFTAAWAAEVVIPDAALKAAIWQALGRPLPVGALTEQDMLGLTNLNAGYYGVKSLEGLGAGRYPELCVWVGFIFYRFSVAQGGEINRSPYFSAN